VIEKGSLESPGQSEIRWRWEGFIPRSFVFSLDLWRDLSGLLEVPLPLGRLAVSPDYHSHVRRQDPSCLLDGNNSSA
jgi:hypothetical protein